uniref:Secreted protein n=1 Tax=Pyxicephalus adspersus TaxID=30357 RepID=A0AAV3AED8_PYXAD|nr:TPA: hypothetical protein GDO54_009983 [Pyxicephalus adspersus]
MHPWALFATCSLESSVALYLLNVSEAMCLVCVPTNEPSLDFASYDHIHVKDFTSMKMVKLTGVSATCIWHCVHVYCGNCSTQLY